ncbi:hypothetical protein AGMMS49965_01560 [Bacteroidia bacterium]|nr:hypothetical protein AGMMS49965_01560 [Bacteroidia bacterium]
MQFADETKASHLLQNVSYYRFSGYWYPFLAVFVDSAKHRVTLAKISEELSRSDEEFIMSFKSKYTNPFPPSFILLEITSFGALSRLYENLKSGKAKKDIANLFCLSDKVFASWLHSLVYVRNVCAHHARIWNKWLQVQPLFPKHTSNIWLIDKTVSNRRMYYVLSMIIYLLNTVNPKHTFRQKLAALFAKYSNVDKRAMGFPADWDNEPLWIV